MVFDVYMMPREALLVARPKGILDAETAERIIEFIELKEEQVETGFNRFCDFTLLDDIQLWPDEVLHLAVRRREFNPNTVHVKSAFLATNAFAFEIARMYEQLLNSPRIEVRAWNNLQAAADWLGVNAEKLVL
jgi:hypothetical protein